MFDSQAPDIEIIANADNNIHDETSIHTHSQAQAREYESDLVDAIAQHTRPAETDVIFQERTQGVEDAEE